jgi:hypothetical protein
VCERPKNMRDSTRSGDDGFERVGKSASGGKVKVKKRRHDEEK